MIILFVNLKNDFPNKTILSSLYLLIFSLYSNFINTNSLLSEIKLWKRKWIAFKDTDRPNTTIESLNYCNPELFPNIHFY
jgi:hypothetical protein